MPTRERITIEEFKDWLKQFDTNRDGRISRKELREALRRRGARFAGLRARFAVWRADKNHSGAVDEEEVEHLIELAERDLGFMITARGAPPPAAAKLSMGNPRMSSSASLNKEYNTRCIRELSMHASSS